MCKCNEGELSFANDLNNLKADKEWTNGHENIGSYSHNDSSCTDRKQFFPTVCSTLTND